MMRRASNFLRGAIAALAIASAALFASGGLARAGAYSSAAAESNHVVTGQHYVQSIYAWSSVAGYLMTFDATSVPADGAVTPKECIPVPAGSYGAHELVATQDNYGAGLVLVYSTTGCFTKTASATAFFYARYK